MTPTTARLLELAWTQGWQVALLAVAIAAIVALACRRRPHLAYLLWMLVIVKALTPPILPSPTGVFSWALAERAAAVAQPRQFVFTTVPRIEPAAAAAPVDAPPNVERSNPPSLPAIAPPTVDTRQRALGVVLALWIAGTTLLAGYTLARWLLLLRMLRRTRVPVESEQREQFGAIARQLGLRRCPRLVVTSAPLGPAAFGWWPGAVILPQSLVATKTSAELAPILAHELVHLRRFDTLAGNLQLIAQLVWWFHPAVWWANRQARIERERACDEEVLATLSYPAKDYAHMLVEILAWRNQLPTALPWPAMRSRDVTKQRLDLILHRQGAFRRRASWRTWGIALLVAVATLPGAALHLAAAPRNADSVSLQNQLPLSTAPDSASEPPPAAEQKDLQRQQEFIAELEQLGVKAKQHGYSFPKPRWVLSISLPPSWQPGDQPLPLDRLESEASVLVGGTAPETPPDEARLRAQLLALKLLPASATLSVSYTSENVAALDVLKQLPALEQLGVGPYVDYTKVDQAAKAMPATFGLETLTQLRTLSIAAAPSDLARVAALTNLETLGLSGEFPGAELDKLASLAKLRQLSLYGGPIEADSYVSLACLDGMPKLETLFCGDKCRIDDTAVQHIGSNPSLRVLTLYFDHLTDAGLRRLAQSKELRWLTASDTANTGKITPAGLAHLGMLSKLQTLQLNAWAPPGQTPLTITDEAVAGWATLDDLRSLRVQPGNLSDASLRTIGRLSHLEAVELIGANTVTDAGLQPLSALANLQAFVLHTSRLNGPGLAALSGLPRLQLLAVPDAPIDDRGLNIIAQMNGLKALDVAHTAITDTGLQTLRDKLPNLELLNLAGTKVTDEGLNVLLNRPKLQQINAIDTGMSIALLKKLIEDDGLVRVWVLDPDTVQSHGNRFDARWQPIGIDTLDDLRFRLWQLTAAVKTQPADRADGDQQSGTTKSAPAIAGDPPAPTTEQQAAIAELGKLGFTAEFYVGEHNKPRFAGRFAKDFTPTDSPLPLEKLPALDQLSLFPWDGVDLSAQLRALRNLQPGTTLHIELRAADGDAFNLLADIPGLTRLMLTGELPPLQPSDSPAGRTLRIDQLSNLQLLLCQVAGAADIAGELAGLKKITELTLAGPNSDALLAPLSKLVTLEKLNVYLTEQKDSPPLDLDWMAPLARLRQLTVSLPVSDAAMQRIGELRDLRRLLVDVGHVTDAGLAHVEKLANLEVLNLYDNTRPTRITTSALRGIGALKNLKSLWFGSYRGSEHFLVNDEVLESWSGLENLRVLYVSRCNLTPSGAATLGNFKDLRSLQLHGTTGVTDELPAISPSLRELSLNAPKLTNLGLARLGSLTKLEFLSLYDAEHINDAGLKALEPLKVLKSFTLSGAKLPGPGTRILTRLPRLTELTMIDCQLGKAAMSALGQLKSVQTLNLGNNSLTDGQVKSLAGLTTLRKLDLSNNPITDEALPSLRDLKQLRTLWLNDTETTEAGRALLAKELPNATLDTNKLRLSMFRADDQFFDD